MKYTLHQKNIFKPKAVNTNKLMNNIKASFTVGLKRKLKQEKTRCRAEREKYTDKS